MTGRTGKRLGIMLGTAAAAAAVFVATGGASPEGPRPTVPARIQKLSEATQGMLSPHFAVFAHYARAATSPSNALPPQMAANLALDDGTSGPVVGVGPDPALASYVGAFQGTQIWVVPGATGVCLETFNSYGGAGACGTTAQAQSGELTLTQSPRRLLSTPLASLPTFVVGLASNANSSVQVNVPSGPLAVGTAAGESTQVPVIHNVYWFSETRTDTTVTVRDDTGKVQQIGLG